MKLIVGLGNPGKEYKNTRHNVGFDVVDEYLKKHNQNVNKSKFEGMYSELIINGEKVIFLEPQKYMNLSGEVVRKYVDYFKINIEDILVIQDDLDQELGKIKLKQNSSSGGHNGIKNIIAMTGTSGFKRIKVGVGEKPQGWDLADHVLGRFSDEDRQNVEEAIKNAMDAAVLIMQDETDRAMNLYN